MMNLPASSSAYSYAIDQPSQVRAPFGWLKLTGWIAGFPAGSCLVRLRLGPTTVFDCQTGLHRADVSAAFPTLAGAESSGFNLETYIPAGFHIGTLEYLAPGLVEWSPFHTFSILAGVSPLLTQLESHAPGEELADSWYFHGWCFHPQSEVQEVSVQYGQYQNRLNHGILRPDVARDYPLFRTALNSGFSGHLRLGPGHGPVVLTARLRNGSLLRQPLLSGLEIPDRELLRTTEAARMVRASCIKFAVQAKPEVSVVIPIYNQLDLTLACLESLQRHAGQTTFEVIIIDDKSSADVPATLSRIQGLQLHSNPVNHGFVRNCNFGAAQARGSYVLFLNNDTEVTAGWLEALLMVFCQRPKAGAVGAKLIYPDGRLQEAGGIIGADGSGWNYGRGDDPDRPEYNYLRQVDYCSGACLVVQRQLFLELGGFDDRYQPAYYEDADLAFAIRAAGREVYYQPAARIIHHEGVSSGTDVRTGVKRHQAINQAKFSAKWAHVLQHASIDPSAINLARDHHAPCRVLVVDACALTPDADSGSLRMFNLLLILARQGAKVTFAAVNLQFHEPYSSRLRSEGVEHLGVPHNFDLNQYLEANAYAFDWIILSRKSVAAELIDRVRQSAPSSRIIFDTVDLMYLRLERQAELELSDELRRKAEQSKIIELDLCTKADRVFVVSPVEAELLARPVPPEKIAVVSNIHALYPSPVKFPDRKGLMFVGGFQHPPNVDAVEFFLNEIRPLVVCRLPGIEVHIVGSNMPPAWREKAAPHVHMHGYVADLNGLYSRVRLTIAPLRYGAGVKGKVNQSMAHGVPVVATSPAIEGMHLLHEQDVLVADNAPDFADAIVRLHENEALWHRIAAGGTRNIEQHFSFAAVEKELLDALGREIFLRVGAQCPLARRPATAYSLGEKVLFSRSGNAKKYIREGWGEPEETGCWIIGSKASIDLQLAPGAKPGKAKALVIPFLAPPGLPRQRLLLTTPTGSTPGEVTLGDQTGPIEIVWNLAATQLHGPCLTLTFHCPDAAAPSQFGPSGDLRKLSFSFLELTITD